MPSNPLLLKPSWNTANGSGKMFNELKLGVLQVSSLYSSTLYLPPVSLLLKEREARQSGPPQAG